MNWRKYFTRQGEGPKDIREDESLPELVELEIRDVIDLHAFQPRDIKSIVEEYLIQARARGFRYVRIIHGRGIGTQRTIVRKILEAHPFVIEFHDAPPEAGGWGATIAELAFDN